MERARTWTIHGRRQQPGIFPNGQPRTLQRGVKGWRRDLARQLVFCAAGVETGSIIKRNEISATRRWEHSVSAALGPPGAYLDEAIDLSP